MLASLEMVFRNDLASLAILLQSDPLVPVVPAEALSPEFVLTADPVPPLNSDF